MFIKPAVFILGAGASWHYGYPTGEDLVKKVIKKARQMAAFFRDSVTLPNPYVPGFVRKGKFDNVQYKDLWQPVWLEAEALATRLEQVNPTVIDYFLAQNLDLQEIAKLAITLVIFDAENAYLKARANPNHIELWKRKVEQGLIAPNAGRPIDPKAFDDDWLRFVLYKLTSGCKVAADLLGNKVRFVTFNYDMSLEHRIFQGLKNIQLFQGPAVNEFFDDNRVLHIYGQVREGRDASRPPTVIDLPGQLNQNMLPALNGICEQLNEAHVASLGIQTIGDDSKGKNIKIISEACRAIAAAHVIFILRYGFDPANSARLCLDTLQSEGDFDRQVFFTNFGGQNRISRAAGRLMVPHRGEAFVGSNPPLEIRRNTVAKTGRTTRFEMSIRNAYEALALDFASLEME